MSTTRPAPRRAHLLATTAGVLVALAAGVASAQVAPSAASGAAQPTPGDTGSASGTAAASAASDTGTAEVVVTRGVTRSAVSLGSTEIQKILPGVSPLQALQTLPGVLYVTADPWGNNEQNTLLFIHGFSTQQLGYTLDGVPLGDQQYGNYNGLSPQRAVTSENVGRVVLSSGAGDLGTASTSNLGGAIDTFTSDPRAERGADIRQTFGSYDTYRTYARFDSGQFEIPHLGGTNSAYVSYARQDARAWDFKGQQGGDQLNAKFVHDDDRGRLTLYFDISDKIEPNEDAVVHVGTNPAPYTRPFLFPDLAGALAYLNPVTGAPPASAGSNFSNYHSAAQRTDELAYAKYDYKLSSDLTWSNQVYFHHDEGRGVVAGPINQAGLPALFAVYYPGQNLKTVFGGTGYAVRTTEYLINRGGLISNLDWSFGAHQVEGGFWYEHNSSSTQRAWYPFAASSTDLTPYDIPTNKNFAQYASQIENDVVQFHLQDAWRITPNLLLQAGFKSSLQFARGTVPIQQRNLPTTPFANQTNLPSGEIDTLEGFLPQFGAVYDAGEGVQLFANIQKNLRQFITYGAAGLSPWSLGSQAAFDLFKKNTDPETSITYEGGVRFKREVSGMLAPLTSVEGQATYYHVDFSDRLLQISATPVILSLVSGAAIIANVGDVKTDGVDLAATFHFGPHFSFYNALSYNQSIYQDNYTTGAANAVVPTAGKDVPASPDWLNKFIASVNYGPFEGQVVGDYVGRRFATYTNDLSVPEYFLMSLQASYALQLPGRLPVKDARVSVNVTNLLDRKGTLEVVVGQPSGTYNTYPIPPRQVFVTLAARF